MFALEKALAWLKETLNLRIPRVSPNVLELGAGNVSELATLVSAAAAPGGGNNTAVDESGIVSRAFESYRKALNGEVLMFSVLLGIYGLVILSTIIIMVVKSRRNASPAPVAEKAISEKAAP